MTKTLPTTFFKFFIYFIKPYKWQMLVLFFTGLIYGLLVSFSPYILKLIIDRIASSKEEVSIIIDQITVPAFLYVMFWVLASANFRFTDWVKLRFFPAIRANIIHSMFNYLNRHSYSYFQNSFAGSLSNKMTDMTSGMISILSKLDEVCAQICAVTVASITMFFVHPVFTAVLLIWIALLMGVSLLFTQKTQKLSYLFSASKSSLMGQIVDSFSNIVNVKSFAQHSYENEAVAYATDDVVIKDREMQICILKMRICQDITFVLLIGGMLCGLMYMYQRGLVTAGDFVLVLTITLSIGQSMWRLSNQLVDFAEDIGKCTQALSIVSKMHEIIDTKDASKLH